MFQIKSVSNLKENFSKSNASNSKEHIPMSTRLNSASVGFSRFADKQSPKINSGKFRQQNVPFSMLDTHIGKTARGTKLSEQYVRRDEAELDKLFNRTTFNLKTDNLIKKGDEKEENLNEDKILITENKENNEKENSYDLAKEHKLIKRNIRTANSNTFRSKNMLNNLNNNMNNINNMNSINNPNNTNNSQINKESDINLMNKTTDKWMPKNFKEYERMVKTAHSQRDPSNKLPFVAVKEIRNKMLDSDIFFVKKSEAITENFDIVREEYHKSKGIDYQESDVFMIKNNKTALDKNGEKYLHSDRKTAVYSVSSKSNSEWHPKNCYPTLLNHCSTDYHILNPGVKHISKTKEKICEESADINPMKRQKSLCEFIDLTRVGVPNPNKEFLGALKISKNAFARDSNLCATFLDIHKLYRNVSERPFVKKLV